MRRLSVIGVGAALAIAACTGSTATEPAEPEVLLAFDADVQPGQIVGLIAFDDGDGTRYASWLDRLNGTFNELDIDDPDATPEIIGFIDPALDGEQHGLLGQAIIDNGPRVAAWTDFGDDLADDIMMVVATVTFNGPDEPANRQVLFRIDSVGGGAIGGVVQEFDGDVLFGVGRNTGFDAETDTGGALVRLDLDGGPDQPGEILSVGYTNPWAFTVTAAGEVWFADNAAGPDPDDDSRDDVERIGRGDVIDDRNDVPRITEPGRAPSSMIELPDGRIGICGFLDTALRAYEIVDTEAGERTGLERAGTIMPCLVSAAVFDDGTIITIAGGETGQTLQILRR